MNKEKLRLIILGAGVIGSIFAINLSRAGYEVSILARSRRFVELQEKGLLYKNPKTGEIEKSEVQIMDKLGNDDIFDYIFVTVRYDQIEEALLEIKNNKSTNIVTMVNNPLGYGKWEQIIGRDRLIPSFPGAGGKVEDGILSYKLTSRFVQPTTFGELSGKISPRIRRLAEILQDSGFPVKICNNMDDWQKSHLAMVIPMANAIYFDGGNNYTTAQNKQAIGKMSLSLRKNFVFLNSAGIRITPAKLNIFRFCPIWLLNIILRNIYNTKFAETLISNHANNARHEMQLLNNDFVSFAKTKGFVLHYLSD